MPSPPAEPFAYSFSENAKATRRTLPPESAAALFDILDDLASDRAGHARRITMIAPGIGIYRHPDPPLEITFEEFPELRRLRFLHFAAPAFRAVKAVFISYSHEDADWLKTFKKYVQPLEDKGLVQIWDDTHIKPGADWLAEIRASLDSARAAVMLVTQNFIASEFIQREEMAALLESAKKRGTAILWVPVRASTVLDTYLARFQAMLDPKHPLFELPEPQRDAAWVDIYTKLKEAIEAGRLN